jgi:hypothetical protein
MALWSIEWLVRTDRRDRAVPAFSFLLVQPAAVRVQLLAIVDAVRTTGPDRWKDTTSHDPMRGVCAQLHEARDRHGQMLYRLYLRWQREHHRVVIVDGGAKPNSTKLSDSFYGNTRRAGRDGRTRPAAFRDRRRLRADRARTTGRPVTLRPRCTSRASG